MLITNREFVSRVAIGMRAISKDAAIRPRYIISIGRTKAKDIMSQKFDELSLHKEEELRFRIDCFEMKRVKYKDCGVVEFRVCDKIMKSCKKLPKTITGKNGPAILRVTNIEGTRDFKYTTPKDYVRRKKRKYKNLSAGYFTIEDGYLIIPDFTVEMVDVELIAIDKDEAGSLSTCTQVDNSCKNPWDSDFVCPDRLLDMVVTATANEVASLYRTSVPDENPNMDEHQKTQTTT